MFIYAYLTCKDRKEADAIARALLDQRLVACAKQIPVHSTYLWQNAIEKANEVLMVMETESEKFDDIEHEVAKHHSYDTFVLTAVKMEGISQKAAEWLRNSL